MVKVIYKNNNDEINELQFGEEELIEAIVVAETLKGEIKIID
jgi:hypothetical protein